jgi:metallophosphoesterase (TIGR00282 family)
VQFGYKPDTFFTIAHPFLFDQTWAAQKTLHCTAQPGDYVVLATDTLAKWMMQQVHYPSERLTALLQSEPRFVRPLNYPPGTIGQGSAIIHVQSPQSKVQSPRSLAVVNLQGRTFMPDLDNPFAAAQAEIARLRPITPIILVDFHAEATSEKIALARMLDGQVSAVIGTHTHVQTADEQIFPGGTAFLCDAGFTGPHESVLGREIDPVIQRFLTNTPQRFGVATNRVLLQGALIEIDDATGKAVNIQRVSEALLPNGG